MLLEILEYVDYILFNHRSSSSRLFRKNFTVKKKKNCVRPWIIRIIPIDVTSSQILLIYSNLNIHEYSKDVTVDLRYSVTSDKWHISRIFQLYTNSGKNVRVTELSIDHREYLHFLANIEFICFARVIQLLRMLKVINLGYKF